MQIQSETHVFAEEVRKKILKCFLLPSVASVCANAYCEKITRGREGKVNKVENLFAFKK